MTAVLPLPLQCPMKHREPVLTLHHCVSTRYPLPLLLPLASRPHIWLANGKFPPQKVFLLTAESLPAVGMRKFNFNEINNTKTPNIDKINNMKIIPNFDETNNNMKTHHVHRHSSRVQPEVPVSLSHSAHLDRSITSGGEGSLLEPGSLPEPNHCHIRDRITTERRMDKSANPEQHGFKHTGGDRLDRQETSILQVYAGGDLENRQEISIFQAGGERQETNIWLPGQGEPTLMAKETPATIEETLPTTAETLPTTKGGPTMMAKETPATNASNKAPMKRYC
jgi:hypothetical protein